MTLLTYQVFKTVAEMGSFREAAAVLGLTPSDVSHPIAAMEKELGFSVLTRNRAGVKLTNYGKHLLPYVNAVLNSDESLKQAVSEYKGFEKGTVRVGCFSSACTNFMPGVIKAVNKAHPGIDIEVFQGTYDDVVYWIKNGMVDFGFLSASSAGDLTITPFYKDPLLCIVPVDYQKRDQREVMTVEEMAPLQFVVQRESTDADIQNYLKENHLNIRTRYHVVDDLSTVSMVSNGFGICIMPELTMNGIPYEVRRYRVEPDAFRMIGLAVQDPERMAPAVRELYELILNSCGNLKE